MLNELIALLKDTTLVSVIALNEVIQTATDIQTGPSTRSALTLGALMFLVIILPRGAAGRQTDRPQQGHRSRAGRTSRSPEMAEPLLKLEGIHKRFGDLEVLRGIDLEVDERRSRLRDRAERLRQEHDAALHQPARAPGEG